ncbi:MAG: hypothetical protein GY947_07450 [Rhodobacteraceae bacterium]|nr:hypothetical protein [Paracoccaceae bacterium]
MTSKASFYYDESKTSTERIREQGEQYLPDPQKILDETYAGTIWGDPIRVDFQSGDYEKADKAVAASGARVVYKAVSSVEPYHATIWVAEEDGEKARKAVADAGVTVHEVKAFF